jgi:menaquinone-dependent protoporphyrinogen oxidase
MRVLIAYGTKRGGTAGLARMIGGALAPEATVDVLPAGKVDSLDPYDAVIVAGSLYMNRWHRDARRFVRRHAEALRCRPVWFVSSGPLDDSAREHEIPPVPRVEKLMASVGARGHVTFGGRLEPDAVGFPASAMAKTRAGDWRNRAHVRSWTQGVLADLALSQR